MNSIKEISKSVIAIKGSARLSNFRLDSINKKLAIANKKIKVVGCSEVYFLSFKGALKADQLEQLKSILKAAPFEENLKEISLTVVPRFGTISPWSSKATEILHNSGLSFFQRIERGFYYSFDNSKTISAANLYEAGLELSDRMTENIILDLLKSKDIFLSSTPKPFTKIPMHKDGIAALEVANGLLGLALSKEEIEYLYSSYLATNSNPSDAELMMFAQANSEHCRHKIFNADWKIDGKSQPLSLFGMIRNTHKKNPSGIL
jgi:phosphoribosylformylglycinamidine synthase